MFKFDDSIIWDNHNYCQQHMNIQSWKISQSQSSHTKREIQGESSDYMEQIFINSQKQEKYKRIEIANFFECAAKADFMVVMAKFVKIFNIDIEQVKCIKKLSKKQLIFIKDYKFENILADTKRKQFSKLLQKSTNSMVSLTATFCNNFQGLVLIIQNCQIQGEPKLKAIFLNHKNLIHSILSNIKLNEEFQQLGKFIDSKYKKVPTILCYNLMKNKDLSSNLITFTLKKFEQVFFVEACSQQETDFLKVNELTTISTSKNLTVTKNEDLLFIGTHRISSTSIIQMSQFLRKHQKINRIIKQHIQKSKATREIFNQNQLCISFFGIYYNYISLHSLQNSPNQSIVQQSFLSQFIQEKQSIQEKVSHQKQKKALKRKLGHYPQKIAQKGRTKVCCVCGVNKKKSRYKCEECSQTFMRDIVLCLEHFKEFHNNKHKYIPKGVRKGAYKNDIQKFNELNDEALDSKQIGEKELDEEEHELQNILNKWDMRSLNGQHTLNFMASMVYQNSMNNQMASFYYQCQNQNQFRPQAFNFHEQVKQEQNSSLKIEQHLQQ